ncbi:MAG: PBP1A family penicillin-binding protein [Actinomycetia bacterium]|nr:PBP1A family penicillin-binding protein [Actinomycetes bacterium]
MSRLRKKHIKKRGRLFRIIVGIIALLAAINLLFVVVFSGLALFVFQAIGQFMDDLPRIEDYAPAETALTSKIYAADGTLIATFHGEQNRELVILEQIPRNLINAVLAIEDERFYQHQGFDMEGIIRSLVINIVSGDVEQGATTITQGYVKNAYMPEEKYEITYERKIKEIVLSYQLEQIYSKDEILEMYLNTVYLGEGAYGVQAAAKIYFNKDVEYLSISECAMIAGMLQTYLHSPYIDERAAIDRRNLVLSNMRRLGYIDQEEYGRTVKLPIITQRPREETEEGFALYFVEHVKQELIAEYGVARVFKGGFEIHTTLDPKMQVYAENAVKEILPDPEDPSAALVAIDPANGYIKALVGGSDFSDMKFNLATQAKRQPGSTFKIFALLSALEQGITPMMTFNPNGTVIFDIFGSEPWEVGNYNNADYELTEMPILEATVKSINVVYSQLIMRIGAYGIAKTAMDMGIKTKLNPYPAIGLGGLTIGVSPLEVCTAFATLANYGTKNEPVAILKVIDKDGLIMEETLPESSRVISSINAFRAIEIMQQVMLRGTGTRAKLDDRPCAGKTGTTDEAENAWFTGFTTNLVACVWMGHPEANVKMDYIHEMRVQGGAHPAMIWNLFMKEATKDLPIENFIRPEEDMINVQVVPNHETGQYMLPNRFTPSEQIEMKEYRYGQEPVVQMPVPEGTVPIMPMVALMPINEANHILIEAGYTNIIYENEPYGGVPQGHTHRQDPMWDQPVEFIRKITIWVNP